ncbi:alpha/beta-hydrolase [Trichodelitschia bisporula]|uniref:Alpha/beta-hydrolase n=1 Tax=Trichodelitschia bisporula TaxID=703511 RepID=A0A6G1IBP0_9PEZI|nr:alpha/beta-hydrolase [Trichodelitschia bisporula]
MTLLSALLLAASLSLATGSPVVDEHGLEYHTHEARQANLPLLKLPYATYQAAEYRVKDDIYTFRNIRYAAPPVGPLRWAKPAPPPNSTTIQKGDAGGTCFQSMPASMLTVALTGGLGGLASSGDGGFLESLMGAALPLVGGLLQGSPALTQFVMGQVAKTDLGKAMGGAASSEDCLFLDVVVPGKVLRGKEKVPVVNWIYGGAYIVGSKDGMYDGNPLVRQSNGSVVYVVGNYRLGAFGFLGGRTVAKSGGTPNAGFWDQRAVLQWIQQHIHLVNGDSSNVSLWGESAGAGSILHHLVAFGGKEKPLFNKAVIQSPANNPQPDIDGALEEQYRRFEDLAGCKGQGLACLRAKDVTALRAAADKIIAEAPVGQFGFGPAVDSTLIRQLPDLELASGNHVPLTSLIITHVSDEASAFVPSTIKTNTTFFRSTLDETYGRRSPIPAAVEKRYPPPGPGSPYADQVARMQAVMQAGFFACHAWTLAAAYAGKAKTYVAVYGRGSGKHGMDIKADFFNSSKPAPRDDPGFMEFAPKYQDYLLSHARTGDPNKLRQAGSPEWPVVTVGEKMTNVLEAGNKGFAVGSDPVVSKEECGFWVDVWAGATKAVKGVPAGGAVASSIVP